ncbi:hypothetical protein D1646_12735 [Pseudoflavonifractor sp. 60]|uniref:PAS domain-containing protein n=1 Tax=Pseudoflavonifractor sp. 60 TaxID=2304576 RepID=UPI001368DE31|nr:PAS domain-containing protein [Pseudoflavonifractor sp. 60]NBI67650.1 hypothetical protein [Pseudoflavonifractor sp. 60]
MERNEAMLAKTPGLGTLSDREMAAILRSRFKTMNTVDLATGACRWADLTQPDIVQCGDYRRFLQNALSSHIHPEDVSRVQAALSLEHLREEAGRLKEDFKEEVCLYRRPGEPVCWIEQRIIYSRRDSGVAVNILGQDITQEKRQEEDRLQLLEDREYIISSLSTLFFSTYYIDLEQNTFRAVTQLRHVGDLLGSEVNFAAALQIYANHFVHPDDRAEYLRVMDVENLRQNLRWWQSYVAMEYRKLPEGPAAPPDSWERVRATAVLARSGANDLPKTAVYVAQNITGSRRGPER